MSRDVKIVYTDMLYNVLTGGSHLVLPYTVMVLAPGIDYYPVAAFSTKKEAKAYKKRLIEGVEDD